MKLVLWIILILLTINLINNYYWNYLLHKKKQSLLAIKQNRKLPIYNLSLILTSAIALVFTYSNEPNFMMNDFKKEMAHEVAIGDADTLTAYNDHIVKVENEKQLTKLLEEYKDNMNLVLYDTEESRDSLELEAPKYGKGEGDYSETNTQVLGVDEADVVKTDGKYLYLTPNSPNESVVIVEANDEKMKVVKDIKTDLNTHPVTSYVDNNYFILISNRETLTKKDVKDKDCRSNCYYHDYETTTLVQLFDKRNNFRLIKTFEIDGGYRESRKIGNNLYFITSRGIHFNEPVPEPFFRIDEETTKTGYNNMYFIKPFTEKTNDNEVNVIHFWNMQNTNITGINIETGNIDMHTYLGYIRTIYASHENLYMVTEKWNQNGVQSIIQRFELNNGKLEFINANDIPGTLVNQFSLDEHDNHLRVATTSGDTWNNSSVNSVYVLDNNLNPVGLVTDIARGERIYSTRFMGDKLYMVTFKTTDPLFVISLSDHNNPKVLGELKVPGFSNYLHPYDENHLIGFGMETEEISKDRFTTIGLKVSLFNVSDPLNPKELDKLIIKDTHSPISYNHKVLLTSRDRDMYGFPYYLYNGKLDNERFLVLNINPTDGILVKGDLSVGENVDKEYYGFQGVRGLYIGEILYIIDNENIQAYNIDTLELKNTLEIR